MVDKVPDIQNITNLRDESSVVQTINTNFSNLKSFFASLLSTTTTGNNTMNVPLDMNGKRIINYPAPVVDTDLARVSDIRQALLNIAGFIKGDKGDKGDPGSSASSSSPPDNDDSLLVPTTSWVNKKLGKQLGIEFRPFQERLLLDRTHGPEAQSLMEMQIRTRDGNLGPTTGVNDGVGSGFVVRSDMGVGTKYGHFGIISTNFNSSTFTQGVDPSFGMVGASLYANQMSVNSSSNWATAIEMKELHFQANPTNGALAFEATYIAAGTDNFNKRCIGFLPFNASPGYESVYTEFAQALYIKTNPSNNIFVKDAVLLEGNYGNILNARGVQANTLIKATGSYNEGVIDLHAVASAGSQSTALALNAAHNIQWRNASNIALGAIGYDIDTPIITGVKKQNTAGVSAGYAVLNINGTRYGLPLFNLS